MTGDLMRAMSWLAEYLTTAVPKSIDWSDGNDPIVVFTDGAVEGSSVTCGGVIYDGLQVEAFGCDIPLLWADRWRPEFDESQCIGQAEIFPVLVSRLTWKTRMRNRRTHVLHRQRLGEVRVDKHELAS